MRKRISIIRRNVILAIIGQILLVSAAGMFLKMEVLLPSLIIVMESVIAVLLLTVLIPLRRNLPAVCVEFLEQQPLKPIRLVG